MSHDTQHLPNESQRLSLLRRLPPASERRAIREQAGYTLNEIGNACGVTASAVHGWESGRTPSRFVLDSYVRLLEDLRQPSNPTGDAA